MHVNKRDRYKSEEIERLRQKVSDLMDENKALSHEIDLKDNTIADLEGRISAIREAYEKHDTDFQEAIEQTYEARAFYEDAMNRAREIEREYKRLLKQLGIHI